jgi:hypothetical protein
MCIEGCIQWAAKPLLFPSLSVTYCQMMNSVLFLAPFRVLAMIALPWLPLAFAQSFGSLLASCCNIVYLAIRANWRGGYYNAKPVDTLGNEHR